MFMGPEQRGCFPQDPSAPSCSDPAEAKLPLHSVYQYHQIPHSVALHSIFCLFASTEKLCSVLSVILISLISVGDFLPTSLDLGFGFVAAMGKECEAF